MKVVVTLGDKGCYYVSGDNEVFESSIKVNAIDSTAAGDSFNTALAVALSESGDISRALKFSNIVGALTTTKVGAQDSLPYRKEVEDF